MADIKVIQDLARTLNLQNIASGVIDLNDETISNKEYLYKVLLEEVNIRKKNKFKDLKHMSRLKPLVFDELRISDGLKWQLSRIKEMDFNETRENIIIVVDCSTGNTSIPLIFYSIGLLSNGIKEIFNKSFYALHDTKTPVINSILAIIINIILNFILLEYMGIAGLALATSISSILCSILLYFNLKRKVGSIIDNAFVFKLIKITLSSFTMIIVSLLIFKLLNLFVFSEKISFLITVGIAASVYFIFLRIIKLQEVVEIYDIILNKIKLILYRKKNS